METVSKRRSCRAIGKKLELELDSCLSTWVFPHTTQLGVIHTGSLLLSVMTGEATAKINTPRQ